MQPSVVATIFFYVFFVMLMGVFVAWWRKNMGLFAGCGLFSLISLVATVYARILAHDGHTALVIAIAEFGVCIIVLREVRASIERAEAQQPPPGTGSQELDTLMHSV